MASKENVSFTVTGLSQYGPKVSQGVKLWSYKVSIAGYKDEVWLKVPKSDLEEGVEYIADNIEHWTYEGKNYYKVVGECHGKGNCPAPQPKVHPAVPTSVEVTLPREFMDAFHKLVACIAAAHPPVNHPEPYSKGPGTASFPEPPFSEGADNALPPDEDIPF